MASDVALAARNLVKRFGRVAAVDGLSLAVRRGDLYGLVGRNGAGKSTTLRLLTGLLRPDAGEFAFGDETTRVVRPRHRRRLAALIEAPSFFGRLSGFENLLRLGRLSAPFSADEARRLLKLVGLADDARRPAAEYSLGMKQRLGLALLLAGGPDAVLLDEPTNGLDPAGVRDLREILLGLRRNEGATIIVSSHLLAEVERLATRLGVVRDGRVVAEGEPAELLRRDGRLVIEASPHAAAREVLARFGSVSEDGGRFVVRTRPETPASEVARALVAAGVALSSLGPDPRALEALVLGAEEPAA
jgi:ABC-2 type transport system ATP-binding protein